MARVRPILHGIASAASLAIGVRLYLVLTGSTSHSAAESLFTYVTIAVPCVAALLIWIERLPAQLLARGAWWSMMLFGTLMSAGGARDERPVGAFVATCCAIALLSAGARGLDSRGRFAPVAFRGTLLVSLVLALADAGAFSWFGMGNAIFDRSYSVLLVVPPMLAGVIGLLRLRTWGLIVSLVTNLAIAVLAFTHVLNLPSPLRQLFIGSAMLQMVVPLPMIIAIVRGRAPNPDAWRRAKAYGPALVIVAIAALSLYAAFVRHDALLRG